MKPLKSDNHYKGTVTKILCIGEILWDLLPEGPKAGGAPMNVALHLKRLGLDVRFAGRIGNDLPGNDLRKYLEQHGLDTQLLQIDDALPTSTVEVSLGPGNNVTFEIRNNVAWDRIALTEELEKVAGEANVIIYGTLASRNPVSRNTLLSILAESGSLRLIDVNLRAPYNNKDIVEKLLRNSTIAKLNDAELKFIGEWYNKKYDEKELTRWLSEKYQCDIVCVTRGANGALLNHHGEILEHEGFKVSVRDTVGSGDAFLAGFVAGYLSGQPIYSILEYACAAGALVATKAGGTPDYNPDEISEIMHSERSKLFGR